MHRIVFFIYFNTVVEESQHDEDDEIDEFLPEEGRGEVREREGGREGELKYRERKSVLES